MCPRSGVGQRGALQFANMVALFKIAHPSSVTFGDPLRKESVLRSFGYASYASKIEAHFGREALDFAADDGQSEGGWHSDPVLIIGGCLCLVLSTLDWTPD